MKTFIHTFSDGQRLALSVDLQSPDVKFKTDFDMLHQSDKIQKEYRQWISDVVVNELVMACSDEQLIRLGSEGQKLINQKLNNP